MNATHHTAESDRALIKRLRANPHRRNRDSIALLCAEARQKVRDAAELPAFRSLLLWGARSNAQRVAELRHELTAGFPS